MHKINFSIVDELYVNFLEVISSIPVEEITRKNLTTNELTKNYVLAIGSFFEHTITELLVDYVCNATNNNETIISLIKNKAIKRQFHTYFNWDGNNVNTFLTLLGDIKTKQFNEELKDKQELKDGVASFLTLGRKRNELVHTNFGAISIEKTIEEYAEEFGRSKFFLTFTASLLFQ